MIFRKKEIYRDGSLTEIRIWQVNRSREFRSGVKYAFYFIGPPPEHRVIFGYDNHHGKGHHRHMEGEETFVTVPSVSALLQQFRREVVGYLSIRGITLKGTP